MSDDDVKNVQRTFDEDKSSIISSDSSLRYNIQNHDETQAKENQAKKQTFPTEKRAIAKDLRKRIRRMNTTENKKEEIATQKSTYYREENSIKPSLAQSSPFFSGSQRKGPTIIDQVTSPKNTQGEKTPNTAKKKTDDTRKKIKETYQNIDDKFLMYKKPKDFTLFIDKKKKKIDINPGIKYDGSSLGEIFEFRFIQQQRKVISSINKFMKPVSNENEQEELNYDDDYIEPLFDPYQLKCVYNIKEVEQIEFDSDDDDNLILAIQPYDTVTSIGHSDKLVHLPTKFLSRRSDIIVSATMSITLTPQDDQYVPINKNNMDEEQIFNWVTLRNEFRALKIHQAQLVEEDDTENSEVSESKSVISISEAEISQHISENGKPNLRRGQTLNINQKFDEKKKNAITYSSKLPKNGLSEQLKPAEIQALDEDQKIAYSKWKGKYEASLRLLKKRNDDPHQAEQQLSLEDAQKMFSGTFFDQIGDDEEKQAGVEQTDNKTFFINRDQNQLKNDLDLDGFEQAVALIAAENAMNEDKEKVDDQFCKLLQKDVIPDEIRREFDIPEETAGNIIDFNEIRRSDASRKRKTPIWSGQDVLYISLNRDSSNQIVEKINTLRVWPQGFFGAFKRIRFIARKFITHPIMDNLMTLIVLINTIVMTLDRYNIPQDEQKRNKMLSSIFTYTFIAEFGIKMFALGPKKYTDNTFNILDGTIVMLSLVELTMMKGNVALSAFRSVRVFRMFRVLRIARILRGLKAMQQIISVITRSASSFLYIGMLLMLFIFIFALIGMTIFGGKLNFPGQSNGGYNYDSFNKAFFSSFDTLTMENWNTQLYYGIESHQNKIIVCVYYIAWIFLGNFVILNLFLAILLDSFLEEDDEDEDSDEAIAAQKAADDLKKQQVQKEKKRRLKKMGKNMSKLQTENSIFQNNDQAEKKKANPFQKTQKEILIDDIDDLDEDKIKDYLIELKHYKLEKHQIKPITFEDAEIVCKKSLFIFSKENVFRKKMLAIAKNKNFDNFIMALILLSSMKLAIDTHFEEKYNSITLANTIQDSIDKIFTILFTFEMVIKIITMGFVMDHGSYIRESWNQLDFFIVVTSLLDLMLTKVKLKAVKTIRLLRILRPLRFISHNKGMKMIVSALLDSGSGLGNVIVVILMVWLMFAILAVNLFSGKMFFCTIGQYENHTKRACNEAGGSWARRFTNYDNVGQAMLALFCIQTFEGWPDRMHETQQIVAVDKGPKMENRVIVGYFFVAYILVGSYFFMNFFVGVLFLKYTDAKKREIKGYSQEHLNWIDIQKLIEKAKVDHAFRYKPRNSKFRVALWKIVNANWFNNLIMATIMLNTCQMAMSFDGQPKWYTNALSYSNYVFTAIFIIEAILKLLCYHTSYFFTTWNKFDFFVVSTSIIDLLMQISSIISGKGGGHKTNLKALKAAPQLARILRVMRISRILRLAGKNEGLQALLMTIQMSIGPLSNVLVLLMLSLAMFSILGNSLFKNAFQSDAINTLSQIDPNYKNFKNFINGFILVLVLSTGENWPIVMNELSNSKPNCIDTTCGSKLSPVYFILFVLLIQKIMLNLFVLVIIEQFEQYYVSDDNPIQKFKSNLILFETVWIKFTEKYDHVKIKEKFLISFFQSLSLPIGFREQDKDETKEEYEADMKKQMLKMGIRCEDGFIFFNELLYRCMRKQYGNFKLNKNMTLIEINTQFQLLKLRWGQQKQSKQEPQDQKVFVKKLVGTGLAFNPFMTVMYFRISFNKWLNMTRMSMQKKQCEALEQMRKEALDKGESFHPSEFTLLNQEADKQYRIFVDKEEIFYITDEDDDDNELHSLRQSKSIRQFGMSSKSPEEARQKSPEVHRLRSQYLKKSLTKRFTTSGFRIQKTTPQSPSPGEQEQQSVNLQTPGNQLQRLGLDECKKKRNTVIIDSQTLSQLHKKVFAKESPSSDLKLAKRQQITKSPPNLD